MSIYIPTSVEHIPLPTISDILIAQSQELKPSSANRKLALGYIAINDSCDKDSKPIVVIDGFLSDLKTPSGSYLAANVAAITRRPVIGLSLAGHSGCSRHTSKETWQMVVKRKYDLQTERVLNAVEDTLGDDTGYDIVGNSQGGLTAVKMAQLGRTERAKKVFAKDPPAGRDRTTFEVQHGFIRLDNGKTAKAQLADELEHSELKPLFTDFTTRFNKTAQKPSRSFMLQDPLLAFLNLVSSPNSRNSLLPAIHTIVSRPGNDTNIHLVLARNGTVSSPIETEAFIKQLPPVHREHITYEIVPGSHNITDARLAPITAYQAHKFFELQLGS